jgi:hypothetical protein
MRWRSAKPQPGASCSFRCREHSRQRRRRVPQCARRSARVSALTAAVVQVTGGAYAAPALIVVGDRHIVATVRVLSGVVNSPVQRKPARS